MTHCQARKRSRSQSDPRSRPKDDEEDEKHKRRKSSKDFQERGHSPESKRLSEARKLKVSLGSSKEALTDEQKFRIQAMKPMTKEEWDARQSIIRKVVDPKTGRTRLIKGDGEVLEEIVTKERHKEINKQATRGDGLSFQTRMGMLP